MFRRQIEADFGPDSALGTRLASLVPRPWFLWVTTLGFVLFLTGSSFLPLDKNSGQLLLIVEGVLITYVVLSVLLMVYAATAHAWIKQERGWRWVNFIIWPCSFVYAWRLYLRRRRTKRTSG